MRMPPLIHAHARSPRAAEELAVRKLEEAEEKRKAEARPAAFASRSLRRALFTPQANPGSLYRCGRSN